MERDTHQPSIEIRWAMPALSVLFTPVFFLVQVAICSNTVEMNFDGSSFVTYRLNMPIKSVSDEIYLLFRSIKPSGLLLHAAGSSGDFVTLELLRGKLRYTSNLGDTHSQSGYYEKLLGKDLADNMWHQVDVKRNGNMLDLRVDIDRMTFQLPGKLTTLDLDGKIYIAGIDEEGKKSFRRQRERYPFIFFAGCLEDAVINRLNVLQKAKNKTRSAVVHGNEVYGCKEETGYHPITFVLPASFLLVQAQELNTFNFSFKFRTYERDGMLLYQELQDYGGADIFLSLETGRVKLQVTYQSPRLPVTLHAGFALEDGLWHSISASISGLSATLHVDKDKTSHIIDASFRVRFSNSKNVKIGASYRHLLGFIGCMYDIKVQGQKVNLTNVVSGLRVLRGICSLKDYCLPNPCKNGGRCTQRQSKKVCDCSQTDYKGELCDVPAFKNKQTCADWRKAGFTRDAFYKISPKGKKPFSCYCEMNNREGAATIIDHSQGRKPTIASQGKISEESLGRHFYRHPIVYETDKENIRALIETSIHCQQYIKYSCQNSSLFDSPRKFDKYNGHGGRWVSYDNQVQDYWGGATPGSEKCACGLTGTCAEVSKACNCDTTDNTWRSDEGYINDSSKLPVKMVMFSVSGTSRHSFYTLGSLQCFGSTTLYTTQPTLGYNSTSTTLLSGTIERLPTEATHNSETPAAPTAATTTSSNGTASSPPSSIRTDLAFGGPLTSVPRTSKTSSPTVAGTIKTTGTRPTTHAYFDRNPPPPPLVIIDSPRKYITIKEDRNQELVLIILSIILALFILAIIALIIKQQILYSCKCIDTPLYSDVQHVDSIELGPSPPYRRNESPQILQYETSPYPPRDYELEFSHRGMENVSPRVIQLAGRSFQLTQSESDADTDTDRLDVSNDSSLTSTSSCNTNGCPNEKLKPIVEVEESEKASVETSPLKSQPKYKIDGQYENLKDVVLDVITRNNYPSDRAFEEKNIFKIRTKTENRNLKRKRKRKRLSSSISDSPSCASDKESATSLTCKTFSCDEASDDESETETTSFVKRGKTRLCQDSFGNNKKSDSKNSLNIYLSLEDPSQENTYLRDKETHSILSQSDSPEDTFSSSSNDGSTENQTQRFVQSHTTQDLPTPKYCDLVIVNKAPENGAASSLLDTSDNKEISSFDETINSEREGPFINNKLKNLTFDSQSSLEVSSEDDVLISDKYETEI